MEEDVRVYKTKKSMSRALIALLNEKDFSQITIKDICARSLTSKSTFYSHFTDKYDLLEKIVNRHACSFKQEIALRFESMQQRNAAEVIEMIIDQAAADKTELATLLNVHVPLADLRAQFEGILYDACFSYLKKEPVVPNVPTDYLARLYAANAMVLIQWTLQNGKDAGTVDLAHQMQQHIFDRIHK
ncbi:TetR/AcrR family transcriptional regulator [Paenibacillus chitinolyticus]